MGDGLFVLPVVVGLYFHIVDIFRIYESIGIENGILHFAQAGIEEDVMLFQERGPEKLGPGYSDHGNGVVVGEGSVDEAVADQFYLVLPGAEEALRAAQKGFLPAGALCRDIIVCENDVGARP